MFYFSYGSNMSSRRLFSRVPGAKFVTTAALHGHEMLFHKRGRDGSAKCDAFETQRDHDVVRGVVFEVSDPDQGVLDRKEGLGKGYEVKTVELITSSGKGMVAFTYYATFIDRSLRPYHWYKHHVLAGAMEYGLPGVYINTIRRIESIVDPDPQRHLHEMAIYAANLT
jgi:hypothetical protein